MPFIPQKDKNNLKNLKQMFLIKKLIMLFVGNKKCTKRTDCTGMKERTKRYVKKKKRLSTRGNQVNLPTNNTNKIT